MPSSATPLFYTYQNSDGIVKSAVTNKRNENGGLGQVIVPVLPLQSGINVNTSGNSPTLPTNSSASRSLGEIFNMQNISGIQNSGQIVETLLLIYR